MSAQMIVEERNPWEAGATEKGATDSDPGSPGRALHAGAQTRFVQPHPAAQTEKPRRVGLDYYYYYRC